MDKIIFEPMHRACELFRTQVALAQAIGESPAFVYQMLYGLRPVPGGVARRIEAATELKGKKITRMELCPNTWRDIWPELAEQKLPTQKKNTKEMRRETDLGYRQPANPKTIDC